MEAGRRWARERMISSCRVGASVPEAEDQDVVDVVGENVIQRAEH